MTASIARSYVHRNGHVFMTLDVGGRPVGAIWWRAPSNWEAAVPGCRLCAIVRIDKDTRAGYEDRPHRLIADATQWPGS